MNPEAAYVRHALLFPETLDLHPIDPARFTSPRHAKALSTLLALHAEDRASYEAVDAALGRDYCAGLPDLSAYAGGPKELVAEIHDRADRTALSSVLSELAEAAKNPTVRTRDRIEAAVGKLLEVHGQAENISTFREIIRAGFERVEKCHESGGIMGLPTGWAKLDELIGGWEPDKLYFVAARPGAGKTSFGLQAAVEAAKNGASVYVSSQEMGEVQVALRVLSQEARVSAERLRAGRLHDEDWPKLSRAAASLVDLTGWFDTRTGITFDQLRASVLRIHAKQPVGFVLVDYVQMMRGSGEESKVYALEAIAYGLKKLAKEIKAPVVCLSQLNREAEGETKGRNAKAEAPGTSKMRGSGGLEQAADVVVILWPPDPKTRPNDVEVRIAKHRDGRTGKFVATFQREWTRFAE